MCARQRALLETVSNPGGAGCRVRVEPDRERNYRDRDSQSASVLRVNFLQAIVKISGCPTYLTYLRQTGTLSHFTTFCSTLLVISWL